MVDRYCAKSVMRSLQNMPVTAILGPRQCGKTTLVKMLLDEDPHMVYIDLERPDDFRALSDPAGFFDAYPDKLLCIDEIQRVPEIFAVIRATVDKYSRNGQFLLLGSASPSLLRQTSESLAGRIRYIELTPFLANETDRDQETLRTLWLRGGFPRSFLAPDDLSSYEWRQDFVRTFLERDIPSLGFRIPGNNMRRFWTMLSHCNAQVLNRSKLGESLGISHHTVQHHLDILVDSFMIRTLQPLENNTRKRLVKSPKIYFRDTGILHSLSGIKTRQNLMSHPDYGSSWESFVLESICGTQEIGRNWQFYFYGVHSGGEIDLVLDNGIQRIGAEFKVSSAPELPKNLLSSMHDAKVAKCRIIAPVKYTYPLHENVVVTPLHDFIDYLLGEPN